MKRKQTENEREKKKNHGGEEKLLESESIPNIARDGAKVGDIVIGTSKTNYGLAIELLDDAAPIARRGHLARVVNEAFIGNKPVEEWKQQAIKHIDMNKIDAEKLNDDEFVLLVKIILDSESAARHVINNLLKAHPISDLAQTEESLLEKCRQINYNIEMATRPLHACLLEVRFKFIDAGSGTKSSIFRQMMNEADDSSSGYTFDDIAQRIQQDTGYNKATFFLNVHNMRHPDNRIYQHEDDFAKRYRLNAATKLSAGAPSFKNTLSNNVNVAYVLTVSDDNVHCSLGPMKEEYETYKIWTFPATPSLLFCLNDTTKDVQKAETAKNNKLEEKTGQRIKITAGLLKSLLQKLIRRGLGDDNAENAVITAMRIKQLPTTYNPQFHSSSTGLASLLQRLVVIIIEDVGFTESLGPVCWMAHIAAHDRDWVPSESLWRFIRKFVYQMASRVSRQLYHSTCTLKPTAVDDYISLALRKDKSTLKLSEKQLALILGVELRCREPGMEGDKIMMRRMITNVIQGISEPKEQLKQVPKHIIDGEFTWRDEVLLDNKVAVDFHAYPAIVDRIFEESILIYSHYFQLVKQSKKRKTSAVEELRNDMWQYQSSFNMRDQKPVFGDVKRHSFWVNTVVPVFNTAVNNYLVQY